ASNRQSLYSSFEGRCRYESPQAWLTRSSSRFKWVRKGRLSRRQRQRRFQRSYRSGSIVANRKSQKIVPGGKVEIGMEWKSLAAEFLVNGLGNGCIQPLIVVRDAFSLAGKRSHVKFQIAVTSPTVGIAKHRARIDPHVNGYFRLARTGRNDARIEYHHGGRQSASCQSCQDLI